jgi:hypothetical protein
MLLQNADTPFEVFHRTGKHGWVCVVLPGLVVCCGRASAPRGRASGAACRLGAWRHCRGRRSVDRVASRAALERVARRVSASRLPPTRLASTGRRGLRLFAVRLSSRILPALRARASPLGQTLLLQRTDLARSPEAPIPGRHAATPPSHAAHPALLAAMAQGSWTPSLGVADHPGRQSTIATARTGDPSAPSTGNGRAMNVHRGAPIWSRFVRYSTTVTPAGKNA